MAVLKESEPWKIHSARRLHDQAQQAYMWQFYMLGFPPLLDEDMMMLAQSCTIPGFSFEKKSYNVAGQEQYYLGGKSMRGGDVNVRFLETEGGKVDTFFRLWANLIDVPSPETLRVSRWRRGRGFGEAVSGHARSALVRLVKRDGTVGVELLLTRLQLVEFSGYDLNYADSRPLILPVKMTCDDVIRNPFV